MFENVRERKSNLLPEPSFTAPERDRTVHPVTTRLERAPLVVLGHIPSSPVSIWQSEMAIFSPPSMSIASLFGVFQSPNIFTPETTTSRFMYKFNVQSAL
eukprot:c39380_g1_i1.p2 GENE.c39380_g1_i1~~c39380_g1_i1.p2  ORF type:complete len:100 (-),score=4.35 c39380_g1_i1:563-862(-)